MKREIPVYTIHLPEYSVDAEPNHQAVGKIVDDEIKKHFMGQKIAIRGLGSQEHPGKSIDELVEIIKRDGTDRYDPDRIGDRYENTQNKHIDLFVLNRKVSEKSKIFWQLSWSFYASPLKVRGYPVRVDILVIYDPAQLKAVRTIHTHQGFEDHKRDGHTFKNPENKSAAIKGIFKITS